jgi:hypothetical protein
MTVAISTLQPSLRIELPGIIEPALNDAIYRVLRQFFWQSEAWKYTYDNGLDWTSGETALPVPTPGTDTPLKCIVKRVDTVFYDLGGDNWDREIEFKTRDELDRENPDWNSETGTSPSAWTIDNNGGARLIPIPTATVTTGLLIRSIIVPVFTAVTDTLPDFLYYEYEETMKAGVLAQLMKQPGKDWSNPRMAVYYQELFGQGIIAANSRAEAGFGQPKDTMAYGGL